MTEVDIFNPLSNVDVLKSFLTEVLFKDVDEAKQVLFKLLLPFVTVQNKLCNPLLEKIFNSTFDITLYRFFLPNTSETITAITDQTDEDGNNIAFLLANANKAALLKLCLEQCPELALHTNNQSETLVHICLQDQEHANNCLPIALQYAAEHVNTRNRSDRAPLQLVWDNNLNIASANQLLAAGADVRVLAIESLLSTTPAMKKSLIAHCRARLLVATPEATLAD